MSASEPIPLAEVATRLDKAEHTIRGWVRDGLLPEHLRPDREGGRNKLVWAEDQMSGLKAFAEQRASRRGWQGARAAR